MVNTKCPARYKNLGLETFGNKKKVTEEILKQFCKNDEYLYQKIRVLLDLTDPESRKRFHPPYLEDEIKSFGYIETKDNEGKSCYQFDNGNRYTFHVDFKTSNDNYYEDENGRHYNDESIIDFNKSTNVDIVVEDSDKNGFVTAKQGEDKDYGTPEKSHIIKGEKGTTKQTIDKIGKVKKDSYCYGPYGAMKPNGWWYVGFDKNKNYHVKSKWRKKPYTEGIPTKCRAQTFTAQHTGYITKVNLNVITESKKKTASPFCCEIWETKKGKPYGGAIARVTKQFVDSNAYVGAHIKTFEFKKKVIVKKGHKYAIVMRSPLSHEGACYRIAGWPRTCYTNYMKGTYYYGAAYQSLDNGKTWLKYDKNAYGKLKASKSTMPIAFGFEVFVQPAKIEVKKTKGTKDKKVIDQKEVIDIRHTYSTEDNYIYFNIPVTNPISMLNIQPCCEDESIDEHNYIEWEISYTGNDWGSMKPVNDMGHGAGEYNLSEVKPTFVSVRAHLVNENENNTPKLKCVKFTVQTDAPKKAYIRSLPYCPESETMLPACIWSEAYAKYVNEYESDETKPVEVHVDIVREVEAHQTISIRKDTVEDLGKYYFEFRPLEGTKTWTDESFRNAIQKDTEFLNHLKNDLEPSVYVISSFPRDDENFYSYFDAIELNNYPAYPLLHCNKSLGEKTIEPEDFENSQIMIHNPTRTEYELDLGRDLTEDMVNIVFREPQINSTTTIDSSTTDEEDGEATTIDSSTTDEEDGEVYVGGQQGVVETILRYTEYDEGGDTNNPKHFEKDPTADYTFNKTKTGIIFNINGENISKNIVTGVVGDDGAKKVLCYKMRDGTTKDSWDVADDGLTGDIIQLVINMKDKSYTENMHYVVDYNNKKISIKDNMFDDLNSCELNIGYNPLWARNLKSKDLPLKLDFWREDFTVSEKYIDNDGIVSYTTKFPPRDNIREIVLYDEEDSLTRDELEEDIDFEVDYLTNKITFLRPLKVDTPVTIRYTPNLTDTSLSIAYRMDRKDTDKQAYVYGHYFTTRT